MRQGRGWLPQAAPASGSMEAAWWSGRPGMARQEWQTGSLAQPLPRWPGWSLVLLRQNTVGRGRAPWLVHSCASWPGCPWHSILPQAWLAGSALGISAPGYANGSQAKERPTLVSTQMLTHPLPAAEICLQENRWRGLNCPLPAGIKGKERECLFPGMKQATSAQSPAPAPLWGHDHEG